VPGLLITPHVAASTPVSAARSVAFVRAQAGRFIGGQPLQNVIAGKY
jgi:phosphoglycerate dehydrogenase-like enzyme